MSKLKVLSLFSGVGLMDLGLEWTGRFETIAFCEVDKECHKVLNKHWPEVPIFDDVTMLFYEEDEMGGKLKKLTEDQFKEAVKMYEAGLSCEDIGNFFGVTRGSMHSLFQRRNIPMRPRERYGEDNHFYRGGVKSDQKTWNVTEKAILRGKLIPKPCEGCGFEGVMKDGRNAVQAHHNDYNKPLDVTWYCQPCHHEWHKNNTPIPKKETQETPADNLSVICGGFP